MEKKAVTAEYSKNGLPYMRIDGGPENLVIFEGLNFNHKPPSGMTLWWTGNMYKSFAGEIPVLLFHKIFHENIGSF